MNRKKSNNVTLFFLFQQFCYAAQDFIDSLQRYHTYFHRFVPKYLILFATVANDTGFKCFHFPMGHHYYLKTLQYFCHIDQIAINLAQFI